MNRRTFLKSITAACGAAVVCPGELLRPTQHVRRLAELPWKNYYAVYRRKDKELNEKQLRAAFKNTKFHPPIRIHGIPIVYRSPLYDETHQA